MRLTLIYPSMGKKIKAIQMQPLTMAVLAGLTPKDVEIKFYDDRFEDINFNELTDLVGLSVQTFTARRSYEIATEYRKRGVKVILGGFHPSFMPEEAGSYADSVVIGEAETIWNKIIQDARNNSLQKIYKATEIVPLIGIKPDRSIFNSKKYVPMALVEFGRGCHNHCDFCSVGEFFNHHKRCRPVTEVIEEIKHLDNRRILFVDDNLVSDKEKAKELFKALIPLKIHWIGQVSVDIADDEELLSLAAQSGCFGVLIGFESINTNNLMQMNKGVNKNREYYQQATKKIHNKNIKICASFVLGYDDDTVTSINELLEFSLSQKYLLANFNNLTPYPGTRLYKKLKTEKRLFSENWWLDSGVNWGDVVYKPRLITSNQLTMKCWMARKKFYNILNIFKRLCCKSNLKAISMYVIINILIRKDILEKRTITLGNINE